MTRQGAIQRLFYVWLVGGIMLAVIIAAQVILGKYGNDDAIAVSWFLAVVSPPLALLLVAAFVDPRSAWRNATANNFKYRVALYTSSGLLFTAFTTLAIEPLVRLSWYDLLARSGILIGLMQAAAMAAIGAVVFDKR